MHRLIWKFHFIPTAFSSQSWILGTFNNNLWRLWSLLSTVGIFFTLKNSLQNVRNADFFDTVQFVLKQMDTLVAYEMQPLQISPN
jgi:hypothetical protein